MEDVKLCHVGKKLKIDDEVKEFFDACGSVFGDLRDCGYPPKSTRCAVCRPMDFKQSNIIEDI